MYMGISKEFSFGEEKGLRRFKSKGFRDAYIHHDIVFIQT
jgi:hypothetical protein